MLTILLMTWPLPLTMFDSSPLEGQAKGSF